MVPQGHTETQDARHARPQPPRRKPCEQRPRLGFE